jgi:putative oxidoreductase
MLNRLWSTKSYTQDIGPLLLRITFSLLMMTHGWSKFIGYSDKASDYPDPLGVSAPVSLLLTIFAELICSGFLLIGLFTRLSLIPLIVTMLVAIFIIHRGDPLGDKEHAISFLIPYVVLFLTGPGKYSVDRLLKR